MLDLHHVSAGCDLWTALAFNDSPIEIQCKEIQHSDYCAECTGDSALREQLLSAIKENKSDEEVEKALRALSDQNPTRAPAKSDKLFGKWKLLWASSNSEVAKATRRNPLPSYSEQLVGESYFVLLWLYHMVQSCCA